MSDIYTFECMNNALLALVMAITTIMCAGEQPTADAILQAARKQLKDECNDAYVFLHHSGASRLVCNMLTDGSTRLNTWALGPVLVDIARKNYRSSFAGMLPVKATYDSATGISITGVPMAGLKPAKAMTPEEVKQVLDAKVRIFAHECQNEIFMAFAEADADAKALEASLTAHALTTELEAEEAKVQTLTTELEVAKAKVQTLIAELEGGKTAPVAPSALAEEAMKAAREMVEKEDFPSSHGEVVAKVAKVAKATQAAKAAPATVEVVKTKPAVVNAPSWLKAIKKHLPAVQATPAAAQATPAAAWTQVGTKGKPVKATASGGAAGGGR
jgi:hypothetical protein